MMLLETFWAGESAGGDMRIIGHDLQDLVPFHCDLQATEGFADPAKGILGFLLSVLLHNMLGWV